MMISFSTMSDDIIGWPYLTLNHWYLFGSNNNKNNSWNKNDESPTYYLPRHKRFMFSAGLTLTATPGSQIGILHLLEYIKWSALQKSINLQASMDATWTPFVFCDLYNSCNWYSRLRLLSQRELRYYSLLWVHRGGTRQLPCTNRGGTHSCLYRGADEAPAPVQKIRKNVTF